jgi:CBS domain containing-hemolysin-like protein
MVVLFGIILIGIVFDIIGVSVTAAEEQPFHSMAARKRPEAHIAIRLLRMADRVSSFCNDVVGDICGVISGSAAAVIAARAVTGEQEIVTTVMQLGMSALVAGLTIGGKALGKSVAMGNSIEIVHTAAKVIYFFKNLPRLLFRRKK